MTPEAQIIAIAEVCGWTDVRYTDAYGGWQGYAPGKKCFTEQVPNYPGSLDAMLSAFHVLTPQQWDAFLFSVLGNASGAKWASFDQIIYLMKQPPDKLAQHFLRAVGRWQEKGEK